MTVRSYKTPAAFKTALEQRLRGASSTGVDFARRRQLVVFDRFLARVVQIFGDNALLKGGLVLELRLEHARTTKDVDLRLTGSPDGVLARLQEAGRLDLGDFMTFEIARDTEHPDIQNDGMKYDGLRFRAECKLAGKRYGDPFGVDVAFGDPYIGEHERREHVRSLPGRAGRRPRCSRDAHQMRLPVGPSSSGEYRPDAASPPRLGRDRSALSSPWAGARESSHCQRRDPVTPRTASPTA